MLKTFGLHGVVLDVDSVSEQPFIYTETFVPRPPSTLTSDYTDRLLFRVRIKKPDWVLSCQMTCLRFSQGPRSELMLECKLLIFSAVCTRPHCYCGVFGGFFSISRVQYAPALYLPSSKGELSCWPCWMDDLSLSQLLNRFKEIVLLITSCYWF